MRLRGGRPLHPSASRRLLFIASLLGAAVVAVLGCSPLAAQASAHSPAVRREYSAPPCSDRSAYLSAIPSLEAQRSVILPNSRGRFTAKTWCVPGASPRWFLGVTIGGIQQISYLRPNSVLGSIGVLAIDQYSTTESPVIFVLDFVGANTSWVQLFQVSRGAVKPVALRGTETGFELACGGSITHGWGLSYRATTGNRLIVMQSGWTVDPPLLYANSNVSRSYLAAHQKVMATFTRWVLGGDPLRDLTEKALPDRITTMGHGESLGSRGGCEAE